VTTRAASLSAWFDDGFGSRLCENTGIQSSRSKSFLISSV
jgi:hypothetical protein